jgi:ssRNA-specific RNase YbeY (16S rRNA maturation enzyme)
VLSFPASGYKTDEDARLLGDIVIAYETLERECDDEHRVFLHHLPISRCMVFFTSSGTITKRIPKSRRWKG